MSAPRIAVVVFPGSNDDHDAVWALKALGADPVRVWHTEAELPEVGAVVLPGGAQPSFDKQFVRDYCEALGWDKTYPGPELPEDVVAGTRARYVEAFEQLTGISFDDYLADPEVVLR